MTLARDLLEQATHLARREPGRPRQASLRRAISAAYYALFHLLVDASVRFVLGATPRHAHTRDVLSRRYDHTTMKEAAAKFDSARGEPWVSGASLPSDLVEVARAFVRAQRLRHEADYDPARSWTRGEVLGEVARIERAFARWEHVRANPAAEAFLVALLVKARRA